MYLIAASDERLQSLAYNKLLNAYDYNKHVHTKTSQSTALIFSILFIVSLRITYVYLTILQEENFHWNLVFAISLMPNSLI